jgi:hypothetical protein
MFVLDELGRLSWDVWGCVDRGGACGLWIVFPEVPSCVFFQNTDYQQEILTKELRLFADRSDLCNTMFDTCPWLQSPVDWRKLWQIIHLVKMVFCRSVYSFLVAPFDYLSWDHLREEETYLKYPFPIYYQTFWIAFCHRMIIGFFLLILLWIIVA